MNPAGLNGKQIFLIIGAIISVLMVIGPQLTDLLGTGVAKNVTSVAGIMNLMINAVMAVLTGTVAPSVQLQQMVALPGGQDALVRNVLSMPGIDSIDVNRRASPELAALAVDPNVDKISAKTSDISAVTRTAAANGAAVGAG